MNLKLLKFLWVDLFKALRPLVLNVCGLKKKVEGGVVEQLIKSCAILDVQCEHLRTEKRFGQSVCKFYQAFYSLFLF